jgi:hypothetical protein
MRAPHPTTPTPQAPPTHRRSSRPPPPRFLLQYRPFARRNRIYAPHRHRGSAVLCDEEWRSALWRPSALLHAF